MQEMMDFALWFLGQLPAFLMSPPISAFVGIFFLLAIGRVFREMITL